MKIKFVNVYLADRACGGPEEGGWWFDTGEALKSIPCLPAKAERLLDRVRRWCERQNRLEHRRPKWSVLCTGVYEANLEDHPARDYPTRRPAYE